MADCKELCRIIKGSCKVLDPYTINKLMLELLCCIAENTQPIQTVTNPADRMTVSAPGQIPTGKQSVSFTGISGTNNTVLGEPLLAGETVSFNAYFDPDKRLYVRLPAIAYGSAAGSVMRISILD